MPIFPSSAPPDIEVHNLDAVESPAPSKELELVETLNREAEERWSSKLHVDSSLTRSLVSFQANKGRAVYRWFKYKEAFSAGLIEHLLNQYRISSGVLLDPFAGSGTAMFAAGGLGMRSDFRQSALKSAEHLSKKLCRLELIGDLRERQRLANYPE